MKTRRIEGLLLDMDGVLYVGDHSIEGASQAINYLREREIPFRFITNTTTRTPAALVQKLAKLQLDVRPEEIFTTITATIQFLRGRGHPRCHLLAREEVKALFEEFEEDDRSPDIVVIGDIGATWNYETLNKVFNMLMRGADLVCMHRNKFWQTEEGLKMDIGAFVAALEYVSGQEAMVVGKPSPAFFQEVVKEMGIEAEATAVVGDDIDSDIGGGQACGLQGILVQTGKYRQQYVEKSATVPDYTIESIKELPDLLEKLQSPASGDSN